MKDSTKEYLAYLVLIALAYLKVFDAFGKGYFISLAIFLFVLTYNFKTKKFNKSLLFLAAIILFIAVSSLRTISEKIGSFIYLQNPILGFVIFCSLIYFLYKDFKIYKKPKEDSIFLIVTLLVLRFNEKLSIIGSFIYPDKAILGLLLILGLIFYIYKDYSKYKKIRENSIFLILFILFIKFREKLNLFGWIEDFTLKYFPRVGYPVIFFLSFTLIILYLIYKYAFKVKIGEAHF